MRVIGADETFQPFVLPALLGMIFPALFLAVLRVEILDLRHQLADNLQNEHFLLEEHDQLTVRLEELRGVKKLRALAQERGFQRPDKVIDLRTSAARREGFR